MQKIRFVLLAACLVVLSGCDDYSSPEAVLGTSYQAVKKGDLKTLRSTLRGDAAVRYGNSAGMRELAAKFEGKTVAAGKITEVSSERDGRGWTSSRLYTMQITGRQKGAKPVRLFDATVLCEIGYVYKERWDHYPPNGMPGGMPGDDSWRFPRPDYDCRWNHEGYYGYCHYDEISQCSISALTD